MLLYTVDYTFVLLRDANTVLRMLRRDAFISKLRFIAHYRESQQGPLDKLGNQLSSGFCAVSVLHKFKLVHLSHSNSKFLLHTLHKRIKYCPTVLAKTT